MDLELHDKVAVVTGASKGIGLAIVEELVAEGAYVIAGARTVDSLAGVDRVTPVAGDLVTADGPARLIGEALEIYERVDVLVNNVGGVHPRLAGFTAVSDDDLHDSMELNYHAAMRATRAAIGPMIERGGGSVVNVCSVNAFFQPDGAVVDYGAAKAALLSASKALSQELGPRSVRVNCVSPGPVETDLWLGQGGVAEAIGEATGTDPSSVPEQITAGIATGRFSTPREVATLVALLASPRTANVTGSDFVIDGGLIKTT